MRFELLFYFIYILHWYSPRRFIKSHFIKRFYFKTRVSKFDILKECFIKKKSIDKQTKTKTDQLKRRFKTIYFQRSRKKKLFSATGLFIQLDISTTANIKKKKERKNQNILLRFSSTFSINNSCLLFFILQLCF